jgi:sensor domain CHASE-containing protein
VLISSGAIRAVAVLLVIVIVSAGLWYVANLKADLAVSLENTRKIASALEQQQATIAQMRAEQMQIRNINAQLNTQIQLQNRDVENLRDRFRRDTATHKRDFGNLAAARPEALERAVNLGTANALRCLEIASGAPLTEAEENATKPSEINRECPGIANPNFRPAVR